MANQARHSSKGGMQLWSAPYEKILHRPTGTFQKQFPFQQLVGSITSRIQYLKNPRRAVKRSSWPVCSWKVFFTGLIICMYTHTYRPDLKSFFFQSLFKLFMVNVRKKHKKVVKCKLSYTSHICEPQTISCPHPPFPSLILSLGRIPMRKEKPLVAAVAPGSEAHGG